MFPRVAAVLVAVLLVLPAAAQEPEPQAGKAPAQPAADSRAAAPQILRGPAVVLDGDTIEIAGQRIRIFGIDAPEMHAPLGHFARGALDDLIAGTDVECTRQGADRHRRIVARCAVRGQDVGEAMLRQGYAIVSRVFTGGTDTAGVYDAAEREARRSGVGLWKRDTREEYGSLYAILKDWQTLIAALVAIFAAYLTYLGATRQAHAAVIAAESTSETTLLLEQDRREEEKRRLAAGLVGELAELYRTAHSFHHVQKGRHDEIKKLTSELGEVYRARLDFRLEAATPFFDAVVGNLGCLPSSLIPDVVAAYTSFQAISRRPGDLDEEIYLAHALRTLNLQVKKQEVALNKIRALLPRLAAIATDQPDPSPPVDLNQMVEFLLRARE